MARNSTIITLKAAIGLQLRQFRILKLLYHQHFTRPADMGIMEDVTDLPLNHLRCRIRRQRLFFISYILIITTYRSVVNKF